MSPDASRLFDLLTEIGPLKAVAINHHLGDASRRAVAELVDHGLIYLTEDHDREFLYHAYERRMFG